MRVAIIAPPFIAVPPARYGGTELFIAQLATGLSERGHEVVVYANGESQLPCEVRWLYEASEWPIADPATGSLKTLVHTSWAMHDLGGGFDIVHLNDAMATAFTPFVQHAGRHDAPPSPRAIAVGDVRAIPGDHLRRDLRVPGAAAFDAALRTIHHGLQVEDYTVRAAQRRLPRVSRPHRAGQRHTPGDSTLPARRVCR